MSPPNAGSPYGQPRPQPALPILLALLALSAACGPEPSRPVRIVLVTLDTLRHDAFADLPGQPSPMPATAAFAAAGQVFERFYAATTTTQPTHATLFTGLHPWRHGVQRNGMLLDQALSTVPERLSAAGWVTAAVVASYPLHGSFGFDQGFDSYADDFTVRVDYSRWEGEPLRQGGFYSLANDVTRQALASLDGLQGERQFLWVHYYDAHEPYGDAAAAIAADDEHPGPVSLTSLLQASRLRDPQLPALVSAAHERYRADVGALDRALGRLWQRLQADGQRFTTHVIVTADHGESFGEDGSLGHGKRLTEEQLRVPTFIVSPGLPPGRRQDVAGTVDLTTTLLALAGLDTGSTAGRDLLRGATDAAAADHAGAAFGMRRTFAEPFADFRTDGTVVHISGPRFYAVIDGTLHTGTADEVLLADLPDHPADARTAKRIGALFAVFAAELAGSQANESDDPQALRTLEALGYVR